MSGDKQEGGTEQLVGWFILFVMIAICLYFVYRHNAIEVHNIIRWIRYLELSLISLFTPDNFTVTMANGDKINVEQLLKVLKSVPKENINFERVSEITYIALYPLKWLFAAFATFVGLWAYTRGPGTQYTQVFNLDKFIQFQSNAFPVISPFIDFNPAKRPPRPPGADVPSELPPFAEALGPEEWLAYYQIPIKDQVIDKNAVFKAFARQLGPRWKGAKNLAPYKQVLLAAFCLKAARKREAADEMLGRLAKCWSHDKGLQLGKEGGLLREARKILNNKDLAYKVIKNCNQHAWETSALLRGLLSAREDGGVLAPAQFVWLRAYDRELWYPLNNLGRQSNHIEAIGAMAHFRFEKRIQRPLPKPKVQDAVESIISYMASGNARPIPALDYSKSSNKRGIKKLKQA